MEGTKVPQDPYLALPQEKKYGWLAKNYSKVIYVAVVMGPLMNLPQLLKIYLTKDASGVSAVSWFGFSMISVMWLIYGILHKDKPILFMNSALIVVQALIAIGAIVYG